MMLLGISGPAGHFLGKEQTARKPSFMVGWKHDPSFKGKRRIYFVEGDSYKEWSERKKKFN